MTWDLVDDNGMHKTERLQVTGGWLYRTTVLVNHLNSAAVALCFVPEPKTREPVASEQGLRICYVTSQVCQMGCSPGICRANPS